jgi:hypothetical protein
MQVFLILLLILAGSSFAQPPPDGAAVGPFARAKALPGQAVRLEVGAQDLSSEVWQDRYTGLRLALGLGRRAELLVVANQRQVHGYDASKSGLADTRVGLKWCAWSDEEKGLAIGFLGLGTVPTGSRDEITYYDTETGQDRLAPDFSLEQAGGEGRVLLDWTPGPGATLTGSVGYFSSSDRSQQALRWDLGARLELGFNRFFSELAYQSSQSRSRPLPSDCRFAADLGVRIGWGFSLLPGIRATFSDEPLWGTAVTLRIDGRVPLRLKTAPKALISRHEGVVLVPPPQPEGASSDEVELWRQVQEGVSSSFETVEGIALPPVPGLPELTETGVEFWRGVRYVRRNHPEARWLMVTRVEREQIVPVDQIAVPVLATVPTWEAMCRLQVRLVDLELLSVTYEETIVGTAVQHKPVRFMGIPADDMEGVLSFDERRSLTLRAYADAGSKLRESLSEGLAGR